MKAAMTTSRQNPLERKEAAALVLADFGDQSWASLPMAAGKTSCAPASLLLDLESVSETHAAAGLRRRLRVEPELRAELQKQRLQQLLVWALVAASAREIVQLRSLLPAVEAFAEGSSAAQLAWVKAKVGTAFEKLFQLAAYRASVAFELGEVFAGSLEYLD